MNLAQWQRAPIRETQTLNRRQARASSALPLVVAAIAVAVTSGIGLYAVQDYERREEAARIALAAEVAAPAPELSHAIATPREVEPHLQLKPEELTVQLPKTTRDPALVNVGGTTLITLHEHRGSRYESVTERAHAIQLRLRHVAESEANAPDPGKYLAQPNAGNYEVVWARPDGRTFRIMDITKRDVRAWRKDHGKTSQSVLANTIADQLNAAFYLGGPQS